MAITVGRDPFARGEYKRFTINNVQALQSCGACGRRPRTLYNYVWWPDGLRTEPRSHDGRGFCNFDCYRSYHT